MKGLESYRLIPESPEAQEIIAQECTPDDAPGLKEAASVYLGRILTELEYLNLKHDLGELRTMMSSFADGWHAHVRQS